MTSKIIKRTHEEVEAFMVPALVTVLYPVLIPFEQQDCRIQAENHAKITEIARQAWRSFTAPPVEQAKTDLDQG